ncbi:ATP-dependent helicase [Chakrabartyella piscis]|uniref:ATP-dependent helicase n=1 Tax=Chakrabartyella piscis TaxID=2918914 RepID=UPI002958D8CE|nr:ATP-dependent helicase [Chakrabartyella piscis]
MRSKLNKAQLEAVRHKEGSMMVLAGPGSGKTTVILCRLQKMLREMDLSGGQVLVVTFTKAAAVQMKTRFGDRGQGKVWFSTFHSLFFRILRETYGYGVDRVLQGEDGRKFITQTILENNWANNDVDDMVNLFFTQLTYMKNEMIPLEDFEPNDMKDDIFQKLYKAYEAYKARQDKMDFDDMLVECHQLLQEDKETLARWQKKFPYIMVDEFQDINRVQYECISLLAGKEKNIFVVGDDDQSIYSFRGASPEFLMRFEKEFTPCAKVTLDVNYRSSDRIISVSQKAITNNLERFPKDISGIAGEGEKVTFFLAEDRNIEAQRIGEKIVHLLDAEVPPHEIAIIYRTNMQGCAFARELYRRQIPYFIRDVGSNVYDHWIARDLLAYLLLAENPDSDSHLRQILNKPKRYIGKDLLEEAQSMPYAMLRSLFVCPSLKKWQSEALEGLQQDLAQIEKRDVYEAIRYIRRVVGYDEYLEEYATYRKTSGQVFMEIADELMELAKGEVSVASFRQTLEEMSQQMKEQSRKSEDAYNKCVVLTTMHGAKGLEFQAVFVPSLVEGIVPHEKGIANHMEEERRLFYVAMTRAKEKLCLSTIRSKFDKKKEPSRFLGEIGVIIKDTQK